MFKLFKWPQDVVWIVILCLCMSSLITSIIAVNLIASLISAGSLIGFFIIWCLIILRPWLKIKNSTRHIYKGIVFCYHRNFDVQEKVQINLNVDSIQRKLEDKFISRVCIIDSAFNGLITLFVDDINEKYFNARYGTSYKKICGMAIGKLIVVDIKNGISHSALKHELCHIIFDSCSIFRTEQEQHDEMAKIGV